MAGNPKTSKSSAPTNGRPGASTKGVRVGVNPKAGVQSSAPKFKCGGGVMKKKK